MADFFSISTSALQAFQNAIAVTSNNIANANTPGYTEESINFETAVPQPGGLAIGSGVDVTSISRAVNALANSQLNSSQGNLGQLNGLQTYTNQINNIIGTTAGGLTTALQNYYNAWSTVANNPTSTAARQALIGAAQGVTNSLQNTSTQLQSLNTSINSGITADVNQINSLSSSIGKLNAQIVIAKSENGGQAPNQLLDQRDQALSSLSQLVGVTTSTDANGALNVFVANGQPLVLQGTTNQLITQPNQYNASQLEISTSTNSGNVISPQITSGDLGGLLAARSTAVTPAINALGQIATALASSANTQQNSGLDLNGNEGANLFSVASPLSIASSSNTGTGVASVSIANVGVLSSDNYVLSYKGGAYSLTDQTTGAVVTPSGTGTSADPLTANGLSIVLSGTPASGDTFLLQPTAQAAGTLSVALTDPSKIAAAAALSVTATSSNAGSGVLGNITNPNAQALPANTTLNFTSPTTYQINGAGPVQTVGTGGIVKFGNWQATLTGTPVTGDSFALASNVGKTGDNTNALASAKQQNQGVLSSGTISINGATSALVTDIGTQAQQVNTAQTAQSAVNTQALLSVQSVSGVNLDEEAANLLKWQQAYQASAQALAIGNATFTTLLNAFR